MLRRIRGLHVDRMLQKADEIRQKTRRPRLWILADMVYCGLKYQAGYMDYALFEMYRMDGRQRASVLTRGKNNAYVAALNDRAGWPLFENKIKFLQTFSAFTGRRFLDLTAAQPEEFAEFAHSAGRLIAKPPEGTHGDKVELLEITPDRNLEALRLRLLREGQTLCEEVLLQHPGLSAIYPGSVNTLRVITILLDGQVHLVASLLRVGNGGRVVDNFNNGGMVVPFDPVTGAISKPAVDKAGHVYDRHPVTGFVFAGAVLPLWEECKALISAAAKVVPSVRYVGWDIAVTPDGPVLVEGNQFPGHDIYGLPAQTPDRIGILPAFEAVVPLKTIRSRGERR